MVTASGGGRRTTRIRTDLVKLRALSVEELVNRPLMSDPESLVTLDVLTKFAMPALLTDTNLYVLVTCRAVDLSLTHGNCAGSCFAYEWFGSVAGGRFGDYRAGFQFAQVGYELVERRGLRRFRARTYLNFGILTPWTRPVRSARELLRRAFDAANETGDLTYAAYACYTINANLLALGDPLFDVQREIESGLEFADKMGFGLVVDITATQLALVRMLRGLTPNSVRSTMSSSTSVGWRVTSSIAQIWRAPNAGTGSASCRRFFLPAIMSAPSRRR